MPNSNWDCQIGRQVEPHSLAAFQLRVLFSGQVRKSHFSWYWQNSKKSRQSGYSQSLFLSRFYHQVNITSQQLQKDVEFINTNCKMQCCFSIWFAIDKMKRKCIRSKEGIQSGTFYAFIGSCTERTTHIPPACLARQWCIQTCCAAPDVLRPKCKQFICLPM